MTTPFLSTPTLATFEEIYDLRLFVLRAPEHRALGLTFPEDHLPTTLHFATFLPNRTPIACLTLLVSSLDDAPAYQLRGMAVHPDHQRKQLGHSLLTTAYHHVQNHTPIRQLWCNARTPACRFYASQGWQIFSEEFTIPHAGPHFKMRKSLA